MEERAVSHTDEAKRLETLWSYDILDTPDEEEFDNLARLAAFICEVPFAQINFIEKERQWTKAYHGVDIREIPREAGFCHHTIQNEHCMVVEDTISDSRFKNMDFVTNEPHVRFYAGVNIQGTGGHNIGTICAIGQQPKTLSEEQQEALGTLAREVEARLELKKKNKQLEKTNTFLHNSADLMLVIDPNGFIIEDINEDISTYGELSAEELTGKPVSYLNPADDFMDMLTAWKNEPAGKRFSYDTSLQLNGTASYWQINITKKEGKWYVTARDISHRKKVEKKVQENLHEKEVLLQEVNHRVKNNLAVISSFLQLEELKAEHEEARSVLTENYMRVKSMSMIHDDLYETSTFASLQFDEYLKKLLESIEVTMSTSDKQIELKSGIQPVTLNINQAVPCALIVNELVSNAYKYAFKGREKGLIKVDLFSDNNFVNLKIWDDGIGLPDDFKLEESPTLGITLVYSLSQQIKSDIKIDSGEGTGFSIRFEKRDGRGSNSNFTGL